MDLFTDLFTGVKKNNKKIYLFVSDLLTEVCTHFCAECMIAYWMGQSPPLRIFKEFYDSEELSIVLQGENHVAKQLLP